MSEKTEQALTYSNAGFNCAQSVFAPFAEDYDVETETALKICTGFGGGMKCGELCGAVVGGGLAIGAAKGQYLENDTGAKNSCEAAVLEFQKEFVETHGHIRCRDLLGVDPSTPEGHEAAVAQDLFGTKCKNYITSAVEILESQGF